jgi:biopolymer transport protein ExbD
MAGVNVGGGGPGSGRKALDSEINMIPMIDLLLVTISFLLITAVWVNMSRMDATAQVPGPSTTPPCEDAACKPEAKLHVDTQDPSKFVLAWKEGGTVVRSMDVPRDAIEGAKGALAYPTLAARVADEWKAGGRHRDASDARFDRAVVHASNDMPYRDLIAVMDAVAQAKRPVARAGKTSEAPAFEITFAMN